jgi:hypothetical protein
MDADCATGQVCGYALADGCAASGVCVVDPSYGGVHCNSVLLMCGCDGKQVAVRCDYPSNYAPVPIKDRTGASCR